MRVTNAQWQAYERLMNDNAVESFSQAIVIWKRRVFKKDAFGQDGPDTYVNIELLALINFNSFRTWPITKHSTAGELDYQNMLVQLNRAQITEQGYANESGDLDYDPAFDRFIYNGVLYKAEGDTPVSQTRNSPLHQYLVLARQETSTGTTNNAQVY